MSQELPESLADRLARQQALLIEPSDPTMMAAFALSLCRGSETGLAMVWLHRLIACVPDRADPYFAAGRLLQDQGRLMAACAYYRAAILCRPDHGDALSNLAGILFDRLQSEMISSLFRRALIAAPLNEEHHHNFGVSLVAQPEAAARFTRQAIGLRPDHRAALIQLGNIEWKRGRRREAVQIGRHALQCQAEDAVGLSNLGLMLQQEGELAEAVSLHQQAIGEDPTYYPAHANLAVALGDQGRIRAAIQRNKLALAVTPDQPGGYSNLGGLLRDNGRSEAAVTALKRALTLLPDFAAAHDNLLMAEQCLYALTNQDLLETAREFGRQFPTKAPAPPRRPSGGRLKIGYVSGDFATHPVGFFLGSVLPAHDPKSFEIVCYSNSATEDDITRELRSAAHHWRQIHCLTDDEAARLIRADGIDLLVDLAGHTAKNRLPLFSLRPAPIQLSWLGYYATTGLPAIDYLIADPVVVRPGEEIDFSEKIVRLPFCYYCYRPPFPDLAIGPFPSASSGRITFGCFNNPAKLSPETIALWAEILKRLPDARLLLKSKSLGDPETAAELRDRFFAHAIGHERLVCEGHSPLDQALDCYNRVDIALDPFPFGGGTTSVETLWMGVPLVTLAGQRWAGRMSASILTTLGLSQWVAHDVAEYIALACQMAAALPRDAELRRGIRARMKATTLTDGATFTAGLEAAYRAVWEGA